ncbi:MAG TPA: phospholipase D-like domain-containing protein, partial [Chitinophagaceae bacterium]|nr:phospholipase D-like domain-containing protein [Chitinophagaceae bacterium]
MNNYSGAYTRFIRGGKEFFDQLEEMIDHAENSIHLQTYIFNNDATGMRIADALIRAAGRKVQVYMLVDGYASQGLPNSFIKDIIAAGIHFRFFEPLFASRRFYFGRRLHHKVVVADACKALVGGINITDRYNDLPGQQAWFDAALLVEGEICVQLYNICRGLWENRRVGRNGSRKQKITPVLSSAAIERHPVRIRRNDWVKRRYEIKKTYSEFFRYAEESITIVCSYFLPNQVFRRQLRKALKRNVKVKVVLTGLSDVAITKYAERFLYRWMLRNKIELYEYKPTVLHAKMAIVDKKRLTLGSYNINNIS